MAELDLSGMDVSKLTTAQKLEMIELLEQKRATEARDSLAMFGIIHLNLFPAKHHKLIISKLEALERGEFDILFLFLPPGSAKSTYASTLFPAWYAGRNPTKSILTACNTQELAERFGRKVRNFVASADFAKTFTGVGVSADSAAAHRWDTTHGGEYFGAGIGGTVTGRRADLGIVDDPVASREDADSETMRNKAWEWFINDFMTRLKPGFKLVFIMTRWHEDDLGGRALEYFGSRAQVVKIPMEAEEDDPLGRQPGERLWPEWYTDQMVELAKRDPRVWTSLYQQNPRPGEGGEFKRQWINRYGNVQGGRGMNKILLVDPASGKRKNNDFTSMWVIGLGSDGNRYVLDIVRDRLNLAERAEKVFQLHRKWRPYEVRYERYGMMADIEHLQSRMEQDNYRFTVVEVGGAIQKEDRIRRMIPTFQNGQMWFPEVFWYTRTDGKVYDLMAEFIDQEYLAFPVGRHDDMMDALSRMDEPGKQFALRWPHEQALMPAPTYYSNPLDAVTGY